MSTAVLTSNWSAVYHEAKRYQLLRDLPFLPVRISVGTPRFWAEGRTFPYLSDIAPVGIRGKSNFSELYVQRVRDAGAEAIQAQFDSLAEAYCKPLMLLCFEKLDTSDPFAFDHACHRRTFAELWLELTGDMIPEAQELTAKGIQAVLAKAAALRPSSRAA